MSLTPDERRALERATDNARSHEHRRERDEKVWVRGLMDTASGAMSVTGEHALLVALMPWLRREILKLAEQTGEPLPATTRFWFGVADFMAGHGYWLPGWLLTSALSVIGLALYAWACRTGRIGRLQQLALRLVVAAIALAVVGSQMFGLAVPFFTMPYDAWGGPI